MNLSELSISTDTLIYVKIRCKKKSPNSKNILKNSSNKMHEKVSFFM
jgi:hypothetical protein